MWNMNTKRSVLDDFFIQAKGCLCCSGVDGNLAECPTLGASFLVVISLNYSEALLTGKIRTQDIP